MPAQTSYSRLHDARVHGSLNDMNDNEIQSGSAEVAIPIGIAVARGTADDQVVLASAVDFLGVAIRDLSLEGLITTQVISYKIGDIVSVLRSGRINLACPTGCTAGDPVNFVDATGVIDAGTAVAGETQVGGATWETTTAAGDVGIVRFKGEVTLTAGS